jgi:hypothetical protein
VNRTVLVGCGKTNREQGSCEFSESTPPTYCLIHAYLDVLNSRAGMNHSASLGLHRFFGADCTATSRHPSGRHSDMSFEASFPHPKISRHQKRLAKIRVVIQAFAAPMPSSRSPYGSAE